MGTQEAKTGETVLHGNSWKTSESLFRAVLDALPQSIEIIDRNFNLVYLNQVAEGRLRRAGHSPRSGKCHQVFYQQDEPCAFCPAQMTFEKGKSGYVLIRHEASGEADTCFEELLSLPVKVDNRDAVEWVIAMARDVTREKEMEQQLIHSDRLAALGEMAASVAHEVNNPLGIILGFAQDLLTEVDSTDTRYESLRIIEEETQRCKKIMWNLLEFGRPTPPKFIPVEPEVVIRKSVDFFSTQFQKSRIQSVSYIQKDLPKVWADPQQLEQVLVNLFLNAVDAMPRGGELTVQANVAPVQGCFHDRDPVAASSGEEVRIAVTDTGCGIEPVQMTKIFRPFFTTKSHKGMGLGLPICQRIVSAHGGRIAVESGPLWGTTFLLYFPLERRCRERNL